INHCSTQAPIWMNVGSGSMPSVGETRKATACAAFTRNAQTESPSNCCILRIETKIKNCGNYYVYFLSPPQSCFMAYCTQEPREACGDGEYSKDGYQPCRPAHPYLISDPHIRPIVAENRVYLQCTILPPVTNVTLDVGFTVRWLKLGDHGDRTELLAADIEKMFSRLEVKDNLLMGELVICEIKAYYFETINLKSDKRESSPFFAGINIVPNSLTLAENGTFHMVTMETTIPIVCNDPLLNQCSITVNIQTRDEDGLNLRDDIVLSRCSIHFVPQLCKELHCGIETILVTAVTDFAEDGDRRITIVTESIESSNAIWHGYDPADIQVMVKDIPTSMCYSFTDPHFITLDGRKYDYYKTGTFILYKSTIRDFEVQNTLWPCGGTSHPVSCNCGFVVRENNDIISVDMCKGNFLETKPEVKVLGRFPLSDGVKIKETKHGGKLTIEFPSGAFVRADVGEWGISITIQAPSVDFNHTIGLCGLFDGNPNNDFHDRNMNILNIPLKKGQANEFVEQWRIQDGGFKKLLPLPKLYRPTVHLCCCSQMSPPNNQLNNTLPTTINMFNQIDYEWKCDNFNNVRRPEVIYSFDITSLYANSVFSHRKRRRVDSEMMFKTYRNKNKLSTTSDDDSINHGNYGDIHENIYQVLGDIEVNLVPLDRKWPTPTGITEQQARTICENKLFNTSIAKMCRHILKDKIHDAVDMCVADLQLTDDLIWLDQSEALIENQCEAALRLNASIWQHNAPAYTEHIAEVFNCPNNCHGNGECTPTGCVCNRGYNSHDCRNRKSQAPKIVSLENNGLCDIRIQNCTRIRVTGRRFKNIDDFRCIITPDTSEQYQSILNESIQDAIYVNKRTVLCDLSSLSQKQQTRALVKMVIKVAFKGFEPSNAAILTLFDSLCFDCDWTGKCKRKIFATDPDGTSVLFQLVDEKSGLTLSKSGLLTWKSQSPGAINVSVKVTDDCSMSIYYSLQILAYPCDCKNGGFCVSADSTQYACACPLEFMGDLCEINALTCASSPCSHGNCINEIDGYSCICAPGYTGTDCEIPDGMSCDPNPCFKGVTCLIHEGIISCDVCPAGMVGDGFTCSEMCNRPCPLNSYCAAPNMCKCTPGYVGFGCHIAMCRPDCQNGGRCIKPNVCSCMIGYTGNYCQLPICSPPCQNDGKCVARNVCSCNYGYIGPRCGTMTCNKHCENGGVCSSPDVCHCQPGWTGPTCALAVCLPHCKNGGMCVRPNQCLCYNGFYGHSCEMGICFPSCKNGGTCTRLNMCTCPVGYYGRRCEKVRCEPRCQNGGKCVKPNQCSCPSGYRGGKCHRAICVSGCGQNGMCVQPNVCACQQGFTGLNCQTPTCQHRCMYGGRCIKPNTCSCRHGYSGPTCGRRP
uniref:von Willebrand factor D and EGF domain-containing protein-like n=1 Tax=Saccoglossus kowalevskii TaxID=10224 RepID=A0ABM0LW49_SACKO